MTNEDKRKGWIIPNMGFIDFKEPVTYAEALDTMNVFVQAQQALNKAKGAGDEK